MRPSSLLLVAAAALPFAIPAAAQTIQVSKDNRTIAVTATDEASAFADVAVLTVGFEVYGADEQGAYASGSQRSNAIVAALTQAGVPKDTIESQNQQLAPLGEYELRNQPPALKGMRFRLVQSWTVRTKPDSAAKLLDIAIKAGANQSGNIAWTLSDPDALEAQAATKALTRAQNIAERMAAGLHTHIGPLLYASNQVEVARPIPMMAMAQRAEPKAAPAPLAITDRKVERSATVYAVFQIQ